ncbi:DUF2480 family protein [soil metagenome]
MQETPLINRIAESGLLTLDLADYLPKQPITELDIKPFLVQGLVLMEKPFREALKHTDWQVYKGQIVAVHCSIDALIPKWAFMLLASYLQPVAANVAFGTKGEVENQLLLNSLENIDTDSYVNARVVIKGCGDRDIPAEAYMKISAVLMPVVKSLMYGEPCSTVPVYKRTS